MVGVQGRKGEEERGGVQVVKRGKGRTAPRRGKWVKDPPMMHRG